MFLYIVQMIVMLLLVSGMAVGTLWLWRKYQPGMMGRGAERSLKIIEALPMGAFGKLAVVEFEGRRLLLAVTRGRIEKLAEGGLVERESLIEPMSPPPSSSPPGAPLPPPTAQSIAERFGRGRS